MRYLWVDEGNDPDWAKVTAYRITGLYFAIFDSRLNKTYLDGVRNKGYAAGLYMAWNWPQTKNLSGSQQMELMNQRLLEIMDGQANVQKSYPKMQWNNEEHDPEMIASGLERWRQLQPKQDTSWTLEGMQGGWMSALFVQRLLATKTRVVPQCYNGPMTRVWDTLAAARDLTRRGIPDALVSPFYDAAHLPEYWDGFAFTMGRLP